MLTQTEAKLENNYLTKKRRNIVLLFETTDMDWAWDEDELILLAQLNDEGKTISEMTKVFNREDPDEVFLALFYLAKKNKIKRIDLGRLLA